MSNAESQVRLKDLKAGEKAIIRGYEAGNPGYRARLLSMGLTNGTEIRVIKYAPLGDPVEIAVRGFHLSLRRAEANVLHLERVDA